MSKFHRTCLAVAGVGLAILLLVAVNLQPDPRGLGTHQQLGLPPCTFQMVFHIRCPACGMTTSWAHFMRGHWVQAWHSNAGGLVLAGMSVIAAPWMIGSAWRGRWVVGRPSEGAVLFLCMAAVLVTVTDWLFRILPGIGS